MEIWKLTIPEGGSFTVRPGAKGTMIIEVSDDKARLSEDNWISCEKKGVKHATSGYSFII